MLNARKKKNIIVTAIRVSFSFIRISINRAKPISTTGSRVANIIVRSSEYLNTAFSVSKNGDGSIIFVKPEKSRTAQI